MPTTFRQSSLESPAAIARRAATAARALDVYDLKVTMSPLHVPGRRDDTLADLRHRADMQEISFEAVMSRLTAELLCDLHYHADQHDTDFESVLAASHRAYAGQRLSVEGPFGTGQDSSLRPALLIPSAAVPSFELIADAYKAAAQAPPPAVSPVHLASGDFPERPVPGRPHHGGASAESGQPGAARAKARRRSTPPRTAHVTCRGGRYPAGRADGLLARKAIPGSGRTGLSPAEGARWQ